MVQTVCDLAFLISNLIRRQREHVDRLGGLKQGHVGLVVAAEIDDIILQVVGVRFQSMELLQPWIEEHFAALIQSQVMNLDWGPSVDFVWPMKGLDHVSAAQLQ